jgi:alanine racemase
MKNSVDISVTNVLHNLASIKTNAKIAVVVKGNVYGLGLFVGSILYEEADGIALSTVHEAEQFFDYVQNDNKPCFILSGFRDKEEVAVGVRLGLIPVVNSPEQISLLTTEIERVWIKLNLNINRFGYGPDAFNDALEQLGKRGMFVEGALAQFSISHGSEDITRSEAKTFINCVPKGLKKSICNSSGILNYPEYHFDWIRPGVMIYGTVYDAEVPSFIKPVIVFKTHVIAVRPANGLKCLGYGVEVHVEKPYVAVLDVGYSTGYSRMVNGYVLIQEELCKVLTVMMSATMIECSHPVEIGTEVELIGNTCTLDKVARGACTVQPDILSRCLNGRNSVTYV